MVNQQQSDTINNPPANQMLMQQQQMLDMAHKQQMQMLVQQQELQQMSNHQQMQMLKSQPNLASSYADYDVNMELDSSTTDRNQTIQGLSAGPTLNDTWTDLNQPPADADTYQSVYNEIGKCRLHYHNPGSIVHKKGKPVSAWQKEFKNWIPMNKANVDCFCEPGLVRNMSFQSGLFMEKDAYHISNCFPNGGRTKGGVFVGSKKDPKYIIQDIEVKQNNNNDIVSIKLFCPDKNVALLFIVVYIPVFIDHPESVRNHKGNVIRVYRFR